MSGSLEDSSLDTHLNCYAMSRRWVKLFYYIDGKKHEFECPDELVKPKALKCEDVFGCGLLLNLENKLFIFFTRNGTLMGQFGTTIGTTSKVAILMKFFHFFSKLF
jgi:hypothetical protein